MEDQKSRLEKTLSYIERGFCYTTLGLLVLIPVAENLLNKFNLAIPSSKIIMAHIFLALGFLAAMITTKSKEHIAIVVVQLIKNEKIKRVLAFASGFITIIIVTILAWDSISFMKFGLTLKYVGFIPTEVFAAVMPLAYIVMAVRFALQGSCKWEKIAFFSAIVIGSILALPAIAKLIWGFEPPEPFYSWVNFLYDASLPSRLPIIILLVLAALSGAPVFAGIGGIALIMFQAVGMEPEAAPIQIYHALTESDIIAIPLFTLTGFFLSESKAGERLVHTFRSFFSWLPGGLIIVAVGISTVFTIFTGASGVTILALGGILFTILVEKSKYPEKFSIGLLTSVGGIGVLFPISLPIILVATTIMTTYFFMGLTIDYNVVHFFLGGFIPGVILVLAMIIFGIFSSRKIKPEKEPFDLKKAGLSLKASYLEILMPFLLIAGYFSGFLTLVEASAVSVIYVFIVEVIVHKDIKLDEIHKVFAKSMPIIGGILIILAMARTLSYGIIDSGIPNSFAYWMQNTISSQHVFLLLLNLALLLLGCFMDIFSAIFVILPLIIPLGNVYGIDPVHLGIIFIVNLELAFLTPPVGLNLFLASYRFGKPFLSVCRDVMPFLLIQFIVVMLVTYVPWLSTFLPGLFIK